MNTKNFTQVMVLRFVFLLLPYDDMVESDGVNLILLYHWKFRSGFAGVCPWTLISLSLLSMVVCALQCRICLVKFSVLQGFWRLVGDIGFFDV